MHKSVRGRISLYNTLAFLALFLFILFITVQGVMYYQIIKTTRDLHQHAQNADLYLKEEVALNSNTTYFESYLTKHAGSLVKEISQINDHRTILLDAQGCILADSNVVQNMDLSRLCAQVTKKQKPVYVLTTYEQTECLIYAAPIQSISSDGKISGYIVFSVPTASFSRSMTSVILFFFLGLCISLPLLIIYIRRFSGYIIKPVVELTAITSQINEGNYAVSISYSKKDEIGELTETFNTMIQNINAAIQQLHSERDRLAAVLGSLDDGLLAMDKEGNILTCNAQIRSFFNITNPKTIYDFQFQSFLKVIFEDLKSGKEHISMEIECNDRDLMIIGSPIRHAGLDENYMLVVRNITAVNRIKHDRQKFISSVSHELRTPLTTIIGYTDMILRRRLSDDEIINRSLTTINKEGHRLLRLVDDLLDANRLDAPELSINKSNLDFQLLLTETIEQMKIRSLEKDISILFKSDLEKIEMLGDYDRLQQVFINILHNAIKYSHPGAVIDVVSTAEGKDRVAVSVRDYGIGIPETEQEKIFSAFYRVEEDRSRSEGEGGAGLGLYLVRQIILQHHGMIDIKSIPGEGTNIMITLPVLTMTFQEN